MIIVDVLREETNRLYAAAIIQTQMVCSKSVNSTRRMYVLVIVCKIHGERVHVTYGRSLNPRAIFLKTDRVLRSLLTKVNVS